MLTPQSYNVFTDGNHYLVDHVELSLVEQLRIQAIEMLWDYTGALSLNIVSGKLFGSVQDCYVRRLDDLYNLLFYLEIIYEQKVLDDSLGLNYDAQYYYDQYGLSRIVRQLACQDIPADTIVRVFGLFHLHPGSTGPQGVGNWQVGSTSDNPLIV